MPTYTRKEVREQLGALILTNLTTGPAQAAYDYLVKRIEASPTFCIVPTGGESERFTHQGYHRNYFYDLATFVFREEQDADDQLDDMFDAVMDELEALGETVYWTRVSLAGPTSVELIEIGGEQFYIERVPIVVRGK